MVGKARKIFRVKVDKRQYQVGIHGVIEIIEHRARGEGDRWYYDIEFGLPHAPNSLLRLFTFDEVEWR